MKKAEVFKTEIDLDNEYMLKLFKLHELNGGSSTTLPEIIEDIMRKGIDRELKAIAKNDS